MKKRFVRIGIALTLALTLTGTSCIGTFSLTNKLLSWNRQVGNKVVNELVFFAFWVLPVYEISVLADSLILNSIEFWSGNNPVACGKTQIVGEDGVRYLVECDGKGYTITSDLDGRSVRLDWTQDTRTWSVEMPDGTAQPILTYTDDNHVALPAPGGTTLTVSLDQQGVWAYRDAVAGSTFAAR